MSDLNMDLETNKYDMVLHWVITHTCNFQCPQCSSRASKLKGEFAPEIVDIPRLKTFLKKLNKTAKIVFTGGEPLLVKNIIEVFEEITKEHYIVLITNMVSDRIKEIAERINPERVLLIKGSAHLLELKRLNLIDKYISNYNLLQKKGFNLCSVEIAYPFMKDKAEYYTKLFNDNNINLRFQSFRGTWQNKRYPDAYTQEEIKFFKLDEVATDRYDINNQKGKLCNAGYNAVIMLQNQDVFPCFSILLKMGSLRKGIKFKKKLITCPFKYCDCPLNIMDSHLFERAKAELKIKK